jgi:hypothetical protein
MKDVSRLYWRKTECVCHGKIYPIRRYKKRKEIIALQILKVKVLIDHTADKLIKLI